MKKVVRIFTMLSVVAIGGLLICCSGGGSSSDGDVETEAPAVSTTSTPTTTTPVVTNYLARCEYTTTAGENMVNGSCVNGYLLISGCAVPEIENVVPSVKSGTTFWMTAIEGYYIASTNPIMACPLPSEITGYTEIDPATNCWIAR
ncbi:MAG: hypothetical protein J6W63_05365 [Treponema sp.]|nr:hypothetical protein [Treponema sp.]